MAHQHLKSACCRAHIIKYGGKRRQCTKCRKTWIIRAKRRGPKKTRTKKDLVEQYFDKYISNIKILAKKRGWSESKAQREMRKSLRKYIEENIKSYLKNLPQNEPLLAVADAIWHRIEKEKYTIYLIFLRPIKSKNAHITLPLIYPGHETREGWAEAWNVIDTSITERIKALVCDGQKYLIALGKRKGWQVQRCQFHFLANLQMYLGVSDRKKNSVVLSLVYNLFKTDSSSKSSVILEDLRKI